MNSYDIIGDLHGHADALEALLKKLGYTHKNGAYRHFDRKALFLGDYVDRGPKIKEVYYIVRSMVDEGEALAIAGNHEYNAIQMITQDTQGNPLREHSLKNMDQARATLCQTGGLAGEKLAEMVSWFRTLPLYIETDSFRAVHACWHDTHLGSLKTSTPLMDDAFLYSSSRADRSRGEFEAVEMLMKGPEVRLPAGVNYQDAGGHMREYARIKWWEQPSVGDVLTDLVFDVTLDDHTADEHFIKSFPGYHKEERPVFFGHYWMKDTPAILAVNVACLDYSVAKGGSLAAYRFDGESGLDNGKFVWVWK